jgi:hypothetical protein
MFCHFRFGTSANLPNSNSNSAAYDPGGNPSRSGANPGACTNSGARTNANSGTRPHAATHNDDHFTSCHNHAAITDARHDNISGKHGATRIVNIRHSRLHGGARRLWPWTDHRLRRRCGRCIGGSVRHRRASPNRTSSERGRILA